MTVDSDEYLVIFDTGLEVSCGWGESGLRTAKVIAGERTDLRIVRRSKTDKEVKR